MSRRVSGFHTASALEALFAFDAKPAHDWLLDTPPDIITRLRDYQGRCNIATEQAIIAGRREILLALATGTGKTFLTVAQIYRLLESKFACRVLFLVDRKALAAQAVREFNAFNTPRHFAEFKATYGKNPNGLSKRGGTPPGGRPQDRFRKFHLSEIKERGYELDLTWLKDESLEDSDELPEPQDLASEAITELEAVVDDLRDIVELLEKEEGMEK